MAAKGEAQVFKQWEAPATATVGLNFADRLVSLIRAASQDDVQPQAAKALENLGARCLVSADLVTQGIDALNGSQSLRLRDTKAFIGLSSGGIAAEFRTSTSCIQAFLLVTALEACGYSESDVGEVIYHMLSYTDVLRNSPASIRQIQAAVRVISGHTLKLVSESAAVVVDEIVHALNTVRSLQPNGSTAACWSKLPHEGLAEILVKAFDQLQDDDINYVEISGSAGLVWIILTLFWLNKDKVGLFHGSTCLLGPENCKIRIHPQLEDIADVEAGDARVNEGNWTLKSWVKGEPILHMIKSQDQTNLAYPLNEPGFILSSLARNYYLSRFRSDEAVEAVRAVAEAYVAAALEININSSGQWSLQEPLSSVIRKDPSQELFGPGSTLFARLGWASKPIPQMSFIALIEEDILSLILRGYDENRKYQPGRLPVTNDAARNYQIEDHLQACLDSCPQIKLGPRGASELHEAALSVAAHALIYLFLRFETLDTLTMKSNTESVALQPFPLFYEVRTRAAFWETTFNLHSPQNNRVVNLARLREAILKTAVGTKSRLLHPEATVAVSASGRTAILAPIFDHSVDKAGILDVCLVPGNIRFQDMAVDNIIEDLDIKEHKSFPSLDVTAKVWKTVHHFSVEGNLLLMRTSIECKASLESSQPPSSKWTVHYTKCVYDIAGSIQINARKKDTPMSQDRREDASALTQARLTAQLWALVQSHFSPILETEKVMTGYRRAVKIFPHRDHPRHVCAINSSVTTEVVFFSCQAEFLGTNLLFIQGDANLEDCNWEILSRIFSYAISVHPVDRWIKLNLRGDDLKRTNQPASRGPLPDKNKPVVKQKSYAARVEESSKELIRGLPSWSVVAVS